MIQRWPSKGPPAFRAPALGAGDASAHALADHRRFKLGEYA
jgi:hypothetical protein